MAVGSTARRPVGQQVAYLRKIIAFGDVADASISRYKMGVIPAGSSVVYCSWSVTTGFSAAGTRVVTVGSNGTTANNMLTGVPEETATSVMQLIGGKLTFSSDTTVWLKMTTAGTAAAAGRGVAVLAYIPPEEIT